jgi:hypothetical protein
LKAIAKDDPRLKEIDEDPILKQMDADFELDTKLMKQHRLDTMFSLHDSHGYDQYVDDQYEGDDDVCTMFDESDIAIPVDEFMN